MEKNYIPLYPISRSYLEYEELSHMLSSKKEPKEPTSQLEERIREKIRQRETKEK